MPGSTKEIGIKGRRAVQRRTWLKPSAPQRLPSLAHFRATMKMVKIPSEVLLREERDRRGS